MAGKTAVTVLSQNPRHAFAPVKGDMGLGYSPGPTSPSPLWGRSRKLFLPCVRSIWPLVRWLSVGWKPRPEHKSGRRSLSQKPATAGLR